MSTLRRTLFLLMALLLLTACSTPFQPAPTMIRMAIAGNNPIMQDLIKAFQSKDPSIKVETVPLGASWAEVASLVGSGSVDVLAGYGALDLAVANLLEPLDRFQQKDNFDIASLGRLGDLQYKGRLYELPVMLSPFVLMYNQEIVSQAGVTIPDEPMTWEEFRDLALRLTSGQENWKIWGFHSPVLAYPLEIYIRLHATNPEWWNDAPAVRSGYRLFSEMIWIDESSPPAPPLDEYGRPAFDPDQGFTAGKAAMTIQQLSSTRMLGGERLKVSAALLPLPVGHEPLGLARPFTLSMPAQSQHQAEAWRFMQFVAGPEGAAIIAKYGVIPGYRTPDTMQVWLEAQPVPPAALRPLATMPLKLVRDKDPTVPNHENQIIRIEGLSAFMGVRSWEAAFAEYRTRIPTAK